MTEPIPSSSARVLEAVSTWSSVGVPLIATEPVGSSLTLATAVRCVSLCDSTVPSSSVYDAVTRMYFPTSDWDRLYVAELLPTDVQEFMSADLSHAYV